MLCIFRGCHVAFCRVGLRPNAGHGLLNFEVSRTHSTTHQSKGLLWTRDRPIAETSTWQDTQPTNHVPGGIRIHHSSERAASDPRLGPCGHLDRLLHPYPTIIRMIKLRKMWWAGHVECMGRREIYAGYWWGNLKERGHLENPGPYGRILNWILKKRMWGCKMD